MAAAKKRVAVRLGEPGRPTSYQASHVDSAFKLALLGATDVEIAGCWGISIETFYLWQRKHPKLVQSLQRGKIEADATVAQSLYKRANGYSHPAIKMFYDKDVGAVIKEAYVEHYPPDTGSAIFWLKNRQRGKWRDRQELEHTGANGGPIANSTTIGIADLAPEQREQLRAMLLGTKAAPLITDVVAEEVEEIDDDDKC